jgi:hypothetical protein
VLCKCESIYNVLLNNGCVCFVFFSFRAINKNPVTTRKKNNNNSYQGYPINLFGVVQASSVGTFVRIAWLGAVTVAVRVRSPAEAISLQILIRSQVPDTDGDPLFTKTNASLYSLYCDTTFNSLGLSMV